MVKRSEEMITDIIKNMRGGNGQAEITHVFKHEDLKGKCRLCATITLKPGCSIGVHAHENEEEIFYVIKGKGIVDDNGIKKEIKQGDGILTGDGASHGVENNFNEDLVLMAVILLY